MAYDLALRRQTTRSFARESSVPAKKTDLISLAIATALLAVPIASRAVELGRYRREYSHDLAWGRRRALARTQEVPVVSMRELVYGEDRR